jgi:hypothetical protein
MLGANGCLTDSLLNYTTMYRDYSNEIYMAQEPFLLRNRNWGTRMALLKYTDKCIYPRGFVKTY